VELYLHSSILFMPWCLMKHRDNFNFCLVEFRVQRFRCYVGLSRSPVFDPLHPSVLDKDALNTQAF
jgi:hypothetical protein